MSLLLFAAFWTQLDVADYDAMFRQNATASQTLRVIWRRTSKPTEAPWQHQQKVAEKLKVALDNGKLSPTSRAGVESMIGAAQASKKPVIAEVTRTIQQDYWSNRKRFQWRYRWSASSGHEYMGPTFVELQHPDCESLPSDLLKSLSDRLVISSGFDDGKFRVWFGNEKVGQFGKGGVTMEPPAIEVEYFPPLSMPQAHWRGKVHPIDAFFRPNPVQQRAIGNQTLDGVPTVVVVKVWKTDLPGINAWDVVRAHLDIERGAIPRRIEYEIATEVPQLDTYVVEPVGDTKRLTPRRIVRDVEIEEVSPNVFYPVRGFDDQMGPHPDDALAKKVDRLVPYETAEWVVTKVELDRAMSDEMFELKFPPNTAFHDATTNETRITGGVDGFSELAINRALQPVKLRTTWLWWGVPSGAGLVLILFVAYRRWTRKAR